MHLWFLHSFALWRERFSCECLVRDYLVSAWRESFAQVWTVLNIDIAADPTPV